MPDSASDPRTAFFDDLAGRWDHGEQSPEETVRRVAELAGHLAIEPGQDVLEVGCGTGQLTGWLVEQASPGKVVAVDFAPAMVAMAQAKSISAEFRVADACGGDLGTDCFDVVLCFHSFPHFRDQPGALRNLARALKPGGRLIVMHLAGSAAINAFHSGVGGVVSGDHLPCAEAWPPILAAAGLRLVSLVDRDDLFLLIAEQVARVERS